MYLSEIYKNVHTILSKDGNEGFISMDRWNSMLPSWNHEFIRAKIEEQFTITPEGKLIPKTIYSSKILSGLIVSETLAGTLVSGERRFTPTNMMFWLSAETTTAYNNQIAQVELINEYEFKNRKSNLMAKPISENPVALQRGGYIWVWPTDISSIDISHVKIPTSPFLDYYMDANYDTQFLSVGEGIVISAGSQYRDGTTSGSKNSATVELEIPVNMHPAFQEYIIESLQRMTGDLQAEQISLAKRQMEESK